MSTRLGCFLYNATAGIYGKVLCTNANGTAGVFNLYTDALCTTAAAPASMPVPLPANTTLGVCHPGVPPADGTITFCNQGDFVPETHPLGLTFTYYGSLACGAAVTTVANYPINRCSLGGPRAVPAFPYRMASCYNDTHYTVGSVRRRRGGGCTHALGAGLTPPPPPSLTPPFTPHPTPSVQFSDAACTVRGTTEFYPIECTAVSGNALVYGKSSTEECNTGASPSPASRASAAAAATTATTAVLLLAAAMVAKAWE